MRIHTLAFRGIGPFKDEQSLDIDDIGQQGLFLLDGPTGVGKSTIVDAIVFALFGEPATQDGKERMVSDFLGNDIAKGDRPFVELTFTTAAGTFRLRREPKSPYLSRKGDIREHGATVQLWRLANEASDAGELVSSRSEEVGREVVDILGLDRSQVLSTMFLAQGQFARFLSAGSDERRAILQKVFNTAPYATLQTDLVNARKDAHRKRATGRTRLSQHIAVLAHAAQWQLDPGEFTEAYCRHSAQEQAKIDARLEVFDAELTQLRDQLQAHEMAFDRAALELSEAKERVGLVRRKTSLLKSQSDLADRQPVMDALERDVTAARDAAPLTVAHDHLEKCVAQADEADRAVLVAVDRLPEAERSLTAGGLETLQSQANTEQVGLREALKAETDLPVNVAKHGRLSETIDDLEAKCEADSLELKNLPSAIAALRDECETLTLAAAGRELADKALREAKEAVERLRQVETLREDQDRQTRSVRDAEALSRTADEVLRMTVERYRNGLAAELATLLADGEPCPVCGSQEHPEPSTKALDHVSADDLDFRDREARVLREAVTAAQNKLAAIESRLDVEESWLGAQDAESIALCEKQAKQSLHDALDAERGLTTRRDELKRQLELADQLSGRVERTKINLASATRERELLGDLIGEAEQLVRGALQGFDSVSARDVSLRARIEALSGAITARQAQDRAAASMREARVGYQDRLADSAFPDTETFLKAVRSGEWIVENERAVQDHRDQVNLLTAQLGSEQLQDVRIDETHDLGALEEAAKAAKVVLEACRKEEIEASKRVMECASAKAQVLDTWQQVAEIDRTTAPLIRLADLANGDAVNHHRIELRTYVVMRRFAEVVDAANAHLANMSDGRYRLEATGGGVGLERKIGLALQVFDDRTDAPRGPSTLSGGETFYVSLSLALGLADVVQAEAGGVSLETLFVDEGFGSLDAETLDTVMNVLTRLGRGQRTVGLISHVEELKRRIPDRVEIYRPDPNGPSKIKPRM